MVSWTNSCSTTVTLILMGCIKTFTYACIDMNRQQIQYVADHLTHKRCLELLETLSETGFWTHAQLGESTSRLPFREDSDRPCVVQLTRWCDGPGHKMTFQFMALRLKEIGLKEVANTLSRKVLGETSAQIHKHFLDDPFKEMLPKESVMIDQAPETEKLIPAKDERNQHEKLFIAMVILTTICATFCLCVGLCLGCPNISLRVCRRACPTTCSYCYEVGLENCGRIAAGTKKTADKHLFKEGKGHNGHKVHGLNRAFLV